MSALMLIGTIIARDSTASLARSALPDAPVLPDAPPPVPRFARSRAALARGLQRTARAVEPAPRWRASH